MLPDSAALSPEPVGQCRFPVILGEPGLIKAVNQVKRQFDAILTWILTATITGLVLFETVARLMDSDTHIDTGHALDISRVGNAELPAPENHGIQCDDVEVAATPLGGSKAG